MTFSALRYPKPSYTVVHDGVPDDTAAANYYVRYRDYIKNVVSSEIYATWNENAIYANTLVIMSFTLNRVYTEWYRNKGYNFTITSSTAYDQKWMPGRNYYENIDRVVDSVFANYLSRPGVRQPIFTSYCDGRRVSCDGLSQWGSKYLGDGCDIIGLNAAVKWMDSALWICYTGNILKMTEGRFFMGHLEGKTAIITGGGRAVLRDGKCGSIGYGIATAYAKEGANLVITGRNVKKLDDAKEELERLYGIKVLPVQADVNADDDNEAVVKNVVEKTISEFGRIDVLINNAQASASGVTLADHTTEQFNLALYSGLYAAFYYMKACYPYLKETKGTVINFASGAGLFGNFGQCAYAAAKEGIRGLSRVAANEWGKDGINVNIICPLAWTAQLENFEAAYPEAFKQNVHMPPMGHYGDTELEIGRVCVQLASPDFKYMSGETITLEGGMGLRP